MEFKTFAVFALVVLLGTVVSATAVEEKNAGESMEEVSRGWKGHGHHGHHRGHFHRHCYYKKYIAYYKKKCHKKWVCGHHHGHHHGHGHGKHYRMAETDAGAEDLEGSVKAWGGHRRRHCYWKYFCHKYPVYKKYKKCYHHKHRGHHGHHH